MRFLIRVAAVMAVVYLVLYAAVWAYGGLRKVGSPDPGSAADQALAPLVALIYTLGIAAVLLAFLLVRRLRRRR